jgi:hypothetical protein
MNINIDIETYLLSIFKILIIHKLRKRHQRHLSLLQNKTNASDWKIVRRRATRNFPQAFFSEQIQVVVKGVERHLTRCKD